MQIPLIEQARLPAEQGNQAAIQSGMGKPGAEDLQSFLDGRTGLWVGQKDVPENIAAAAGKAVEKYRFKIEQGLSICQSFCVAYDHHT